MLNRNTLTYLWPPGYRRPCFYLNLGAQKPWESREFTREAQKPRLPPVAKPHVTPQIMSNWSRTQAVILQICGFCWYWFNSGRGNNITREGDSHCRAIARGHSADWWSDSGDLEKAATAPQQAQARTSEWACCTDLAWELLGVFAAGAEPYATPSPCIVLASLLRRGEPTRGAKKAETAAGLRPRVAGRKTGRRLRDRSTTALHIHTATTSAEWKEGAHTVLMNISKHWGALPHRQCYLDPDQPCARDFWRFLLVRHEVTELQSRTLLHTHVRSVKLWL